MRHRELALRRRDSRDLVLRWPTNGANRRSTQRRLETSQAHRFLTHRGRDGLILFQEAKAESERFCQTLTIDSFRDFFREIPVWAEELGCADFFLTSERIASVTLGLVGVFGPKDALYELRERVTDYIHDFGPLYMVRDPFIERMSCLNMDCHGQRIIAHQNRDASRIFERFWPHQRKVRAEVIKEVDTKHPVEAFKDFANLARAPFALLRDHEPTGEWKPGFSVREFRPSGILYVRDENDLIVARLCGIVD